MKGGKSTSVAISGGNTTRKASASPVTEFEVAPNWLPSVPIQTDQLTLGTCVQFAISIGIINISGDE